MATAASLDWSTANQGYLRAALNLLRAYLLRPEAGAEGDHAVEQARLDLRQAASLLPAPPALEILAANFGLSQFEQDVLLLCAGPELDAAFGPLCATAQGDPQRAYPTFSLALAALPNGHWSAVTPEAALRRWRLIEVGAGPALMFSALRIDERVLHHLLGISYLDDRLAGLVQRVQTPAVLAPSQDAVAERVALLWSQQSAGGPWPVVQLYGAESAEKRSVAQAACDKLGWGLCALSALSLPVDPREIEALLRLWEREAILGRSALLLDCDELDRSDVARVQAVARFVEGLDGLLLLASRERQRLHVRPVVSLDVAKPTAGEQREVWRQVLGSEAAGMNGRIESLVAQFRLAAPVIQSAAAEAATLPARGGPEAPEEALSDRLWEACRVHARPQLDGLAQRISSQVSWEDLVLPPAQLQTLRDIVVQVSQRARVYDEWGFAAKSARGLGISVLFSGASGTGKTLAAEVMANELRLDLYRIDLSQVVSKYIGETEKNLRRVFDAADDGGAVLLFDEADALFGKRSEVKDSHDRYANIEISYLLQRMESYRGLAILTTNMKSALDTAFLRRIRFTVVFPFPDAAQRAEIWQRIFPAATPRHDLDVTRLARLNLAGGNIRNIALGAAFVAAEAGEPVRMPHLLRAAQIEYAKLEKPLAASDVSDWV